MKEKSIIRKMAKHAAACCVKEGLSYPIGDEEDSRGGRRQQAGVARQGLTMLQPILSNDICQSLQYYVNIYDTTLASTGVYPFY